jgi:TatD DNase family protein
LETLTRVTRIFAFSSKMMLIDTHAHWYDEQFDGDRAEQLEKCRQLGVSKILLPNIDVTSIEPLLQLVAAYPDFCFPMMGLHPCYVKPNDWKEQLNTVKQYVYETPKHYVAMGEIGIDLYWDKTTLSIQQQAFAEQITWAKELGLPIVIHARDSFEELFEVVDHYNDNTLKGVFHCFTGNEKQAQKVIDYGGFKMGIGGVITFKNSGLDKVVASFPIDYFVLETDSPYLAPTPHRGKRNEPSYTFLVAQRMAEIFNCSLDQLAQKTTANAQEIFGNL